MKDGELLAVIEVDGPTHFDTEKTETLKSTFKNKLIKNFMEKQCTNAKFLVINYFDNQSSIEQKINELLTSLSLKK